MTDRSLLTKILLRIGLGIPSIAAMLLWPAGSWRYWPAWIYMGVLFIPMSLAIAYFVKNDPALLERRMRTKETRSEQRVIIAASSAVFLAGFLIPGFDHRFGWSHVPVALVIVSNMLVFLGYTIVFAVLRENSYASRVVEVEPGQEVISTGPYAIVRHPMYSGVALMFLATPTALGSYWALVPFALLPPMLVLRILGEERVLRQQLPGYTEYCEEVRYRLVPGLW